MFCKTAENDLNEVEIIYSHVIKYIHFFKLNNFIIFKIFYKFNMLFLCYIIL